MGKIRIGQIGMAHDHAGGFMDCMRKYPEVFEVVGVAEDNPENVRKFGGAGCYKDIPFMSAEQLLNTPDLQAVTVETEELQLLTYAEKAVKRGLHVHMDKPAGNYLAAFRRILREARGRRLVVQLGYMYRYNPAVQYCLDAVKSGKLGEVYEVNAVMNTLHPPQKREWMKPFPAGIMFYLGCHTVDLVLLMRGMPDRIIPYNKKTGIDGVDVFDHGFAVFEYKNGISTVRATSTEVNGYGRRQLVVCGEKGTVEIKPLEGGANGLPEASVSFSSMTEGKLYTDCKQPVHMLKTAGRYDAMMLDFAEMVRGKKENPFTYEYEFDVQKAVLAACGLPVDLEEKL